eukprot:3686190-Amphidinium_carterae.1
MTQLKQGWDLLYQVCQVTAEPPRQAHPQLATRPAATQAPRYSEACPTHHGAEAIQSATAADSR